MAKWIRKTLPLQADHGWEVSPGYKIFMADRGSVRFDIPRDWVIVHEDKSFAFHDRQPPDDDCTLKMSIWYLDDHVDWSQLPLGQMAKQLSAKDTRDVARHGDVIEEARPRLRLAWTEVEFHDPNENRSAIGRMLLGQFSNIQLLLTFDFWVADAPKLEPAWAEIVRSLELANYIEDPTRRVKD